MRVSAKGASPRAGWFVSERKSQARMDDEQVPRFEETPGYVCRDLNTGDNLGTYWDKTNKTTQFDRMI